MERTRDRGDPKKEAVLGKRAAVSPMGRSGTAASCKMEDDAKCQGSPLIDGFDVGVVPFVDVAIGQCSNFMR
jgi:hypothetical protein